MCFRQFVYRCASRSRDDCGAFVFAMVAMWSFLPYPTVQAQAMSARCLQVLTAEQVRAAVGAGLDVAAQKQAEAGVSECAWSRLGADSGAGPSIRVQFFDRVAISANPVAHSVDGYFDMIASTAEEIAGRKREPVAGVATRAVTIQGKSQLLLVVQRFDGVARVILGNVSKSQASAIAMAISVASAP